MAGVWSEAGTDVGPLLDAMIRSDEKLGPVLAGTALAEGGRSPGSGSRYSRRALIPAQNKLVLHESARQKPLMS